MEEQSVKAIIFDLDNTLIETSRAGEEALRQVTTFGVYRVVLKSMLCVNVD